MSPPKPPDRPALAAALGCFTIWGLFPLLYQAVGRAGADVWEPLAWRILAGLPVCAALVAFTGRGAAWSALLRNRRMLAALVGSAALIGVNWAVFVWAVQNRQTLATSLAYYINPLLNVAVGAALFGERLGTVVRLAIALVVAGVVLQAVAIGGAPWIALILAFTFCGYGVVRKQVPVDPQVGMLAETLVLAAPAAAIAVWEVGRGSGAFGHAPAATLMLLACGPISALPMVAFTTATRRLPLSLLGLLQYIQPTLVFAVGVLQGEPVSPLRLASFGCIWVGVAVFVTDVWRARRAALA